MELRLDKYLADMGIGTRSQVKQMIRKKQVLVNGTLAANPQQKVQPGNDLVVCQGTTVSYAEYEYFMLYKPKGCVCAATDPIHQTVLEYITEKSRKDLFPAGRLDLDTEGLVLITNDGALAHNLLAPGKHVSKTYVAKISGKVTKQDVKQFAEGVDIGEEKLTRPAVLEILSCMEDPNNEKGTAWVSEIQLTITEGKFHQVKRMFESVGKRVTDLKRVSMGSLRLDSTLHPGEYRRLTKEEIGLLKSGHMFLSDTL